MFSVINYKRDVVVLNVKRGESSYDSAQIALYLDACQASEKHEEHERRSIPMARKRLLIIGVESHYGRGILEGVHGYCATHGIWEYRLETNNTPQVAERCKHTIQRWKVDGIIGRIRHEAIARVVKAAGVPAVNVSEPEEWNIAAVRPDCEGIGRRVAEHFLEKEVFEFCVLRTEFRQP